MNSSKVYERSVILVVGGRGFIGGALVCRLGELGAQVVTLGVSVDKGTGGGGNPVSHVVADLRDQVALKSALGPWHFDYVFNLGGYIDHSHYRGGGRAVLDVHLTGTMNLLDSVYTDSLKGFVQIGSSDEYGELSAPQKEEHREAPISPYSAAKVAATHLVQALARSEGFPGSVARLFLVYGPGQDHQRFLPQVICGCLNDDVFPASEGKQLRDFCYVDDVVDGLLRMAVAEEVNGEVINIASGRAVSIREVIEHIVELTNRGHPGFGRVAYRLRESMALYADIAKAERLLGWAPRTSLEEGLSKTIAWYAQQSGG